MNEEIKEKIPFDVRDVLEDINSNILWNYITNLQIIEREYSAILSENAELQQENETRQQDINNLTYQLAKMKEENERLKEEYVNIKNYIVLRNIDSAVQDKATLYNIELENINKKKYLDYKSRCEKAIEYIKDNMNTYTNGKDYKLDEFNILASPKYLLNILQNGSDSQ